MSNRNDALRRARRKIQQRPRQSDATEDEENAGESPPASPMMLAVAAATSEAENERRRVAQEEARAAALAKKAALAEEERQQRQRELEDQLAEEGLDVATLRATFDEFDADGSNSVSAVEARPRTVTVARVAAAAWSVDAPCARTYIPRTRPSRPSRASPYRAPVLRTRP